MRRRFPSQVMLDAEEVYRINRIRIAHYYGIPPAEVDRMPITDVEDTLQIMWADEEDDKRRRGQ
jgi:hypothetical protein